MTICPLLLMAVKQRGNMMGESEREATECLKGECAWYVYHIQPDSEGCAIPKLSDSLKNISLK